MTPSLDPLEEPLFVVASERSGTTLLYLMLSHHPELSIVQEMEYLTELLPDRGELPGSDEMRGLLESNRLFRHAGYAIEPGLDAAAFGRSLLRQEAERDGKTRVGATVHKEFHRLDRLWPKARYVHLVRDGRDVARSCIQMGWDGNVWTGCDRWIAAENLWAAFREAIPAERRMELRYEDLIGNAEGELRRLCEFAGLDWDPAMLSYPEDSTYSAPDPKLTEQWRRKLSESELGLVEGRIGAMLEERGYRLSGNAVRRVGGLAELRMRWNSRLARTRFRWNRFGGSLLCADFLTRRLGLAGLNAPIRRKLDAIDDTHMK